jgi:hypothetical protein
MSGQERMPEKILHQVQKLITNGEKIENNTGLLITYPFDEAVFPPEISAPVIKWDDTNAASKHWLIMVEFSSQHIPIYAFADKHYWEPDKPTWEIIKASSFQGSARITVYGFDNKRAFNIIAKNSVRISTSKDPVDASIFYRQVQLPFKVGKKNFKKIKWRLGDISSYEKPAVVMKNLSVCASCHLFSKDGALISMEMNYNNDSGAHFITQVKEKIELSEADFISWNDFPKPELLPKTRGLFAKMSPTGKYCNGQIKTDTGLSHFPLQFFFICHRGFIPQCRMKTNRVVIREVVKHFQLSESSRGKTAIRQTFRFKAANKAFCRGVIPTVAFTAHAGNHAVLL